MNRGDSQWIISGGLRSTGVEGTVLWMYGLSGAGKTTIARAAAEQLLLEGHSVTVLDGDDLRSGLSSDLGFSSRDREENIRRAAETAKLLSKQGLIVLAALMTPLESMRTLARSIVGAKFCEVYVKCDLAICIERDTKGLYAQAAAGRLCCLPGKDTIFEAPSHSDLVLESGSDSVVSCVDKLLNYLCALS